MCKERGSDWYVKWVQSLAFCRWKQHKYKEALTLFHEQAVCSALCDALCNAACNALWQCTTQCSVQCTVQCTVPCTVHHSSAWHEQEGIVGASAALCENIGHTYSSMGDLAKAEEYFVRSIELLKVHCGTHHGMHCRMHYEEYLVR